MKKNIAPTTELGGDTLRKAVAANERKKKRAKRKKPGAPPGERGPGRPSKLTDEIREEIIEAIKIGNYPEIAAAAAGISASAYYRWMEEGVLDGAEPEFVQFREDILKARSFAERADVALIDAAANAGTWQAAAWKRERSTPDRWRMKSEKVDAAVTGSVTFRIEYVNNWREVVKMDEKNLPAAPAAPAALPEAPK
jgi:hypothetical protein